MSSLARAFEVFIDDDRYSVPTLQLVSAADEADAWSQAEALMRASPHHLGVELCQGGQRLLGLGSYGEDVRGRRTRFAAAAKA